MVLPLFFKTQKSYLISMMRKLYRRSFIPSGSLEKRLIQHQRTYFWDTGLTAPLSIGEMAAHGLPHHSETLELTQTLIDFLNSESQKVTSAMLSGECKYMQEGNLWFGVSETQHFDAAVFYRLWKTIDAWGIPQR